MQKNFNVLIIEDDDKIKKKLENFFSRKFSNVILADTGLDGYIKFREYLENENKFDLIISDIIMPQLDGLKMIEEIRKIDEKVAVIIISAYVDNKKILKAVNLQVDGYFFKPINIDELGDKIDMIYKKQKGKYNE